MVDEMVQTKRQDGVTLSIKMKRGTGTNDRDEVKGKVHGESIEEVEQKRDELRDTVAETVRELRSVQPDAEE